jgi:hypothetical protein
MKRALFIGIVMTFSFISCEKSDNNDSKNYLAEVLSYDSSCGTCVLSFPYQLDEVKNKVGESMDNLYRAVNMNLDDYSQGEILKVTFRAAKDSEIPVCTALGPTYNYKNIYIENTENCNSIDYGERISLSYGECRYDPLKNTYICFDTVVSDSRCPDDVWCIWAGEARVRFRFTKRGGDSIMAEVKLGSQDVIIAGYKFSFIELRPYPSLKDWPELSEYVATIIVKPE